jgi:hypothetical protein
MELLPSNYPACLAALTDLSRLADILPQTLQGFLPTLERLEVEFDERDNDE